MLAVEATQEGKTVKILERVQLERAIMQCLSKRFSLTTNLLSMSTTFTSSVGYLAEKTGADRILSGDIPPELNYNAEATDFLSLLSIQGLRRNIYSEITPKYYVNF